MKGFRQLTEKMIMKLPKAVLIDIACLRLKSLEDLGFIMLRKSVSSNDKRRK